MITPGADRRRVVSPALVGRGPELARLASVAATPPAVVIVEGEAGIGKTRLVSELAARPELGDRRFLVGWCRRIGDPFPLGPVLEGLRGQGAALAGADLSPVAGAVRPLLPELSDRLPEPPPPLADRAAERHRLFRGLVEILAALGPAVVALEDLHWADEQTVEFLDYLLADPPSALTMVLTFRGDEVEPLARTVTGALPAAVSRTRLVLSPLDAEQTRALAAAILGDGRLSRELAGYLWERTSGLPLAIEELIALLQARGTLTRRGASWVRRARPEPDVPDRIRDAVLERASRLSPPARAVVDAAAVLQVSQPLEVLAATCRDRHGELGLEEALGSGLLVEEAGAGTVGFRHLLAAQAVYEAIPGPRRRRLHARAATALPAQDPAPLGQIAHHLRYAGRLEGWAEAAERAADQAIALGHDAQASRLLEEVLRQAPLDPVRRGRLAVKLSHAAIEATRAGSVIDLLSEVVRQELPRSLRGEVRLLLRMLLEESGGDLARTRQLTREAVAELDDRPDLQGWAMVGLGMPADPAVPRSEHRRWLRRVLTHLPRIGDPVMEVFLLGKVAMAFVQLGDPAWRELTDQIVDRTGGAPRHRREISAYWSVGFAAGCVGHHETADRLLGRVAEAAAADSRRLGLNLRSAAALLDYCRGEWAGLPDRLAALDRELDEFAPARLDIEAVAGCLALATGSLDGARRRLAHVLPPLGRRPSYDLLPIPTGAMIRLLLARQEVDAAVATAHRFLALVEPKRMWAPAGRVLPALVQALLAGDRADQADGLVSRCADQLRRLDAPIGPAALAHAQGIRHAAGHRPAAAVRRFVAAATRYEEVSCRYEAAQAREQAAESMFALGNGAAEPTLLSALTEYQRLGARWDYDRAARLARAQGVGLPARHRGGTRGYGSALSPREHEVMALAATGRTNKEIAHELFLSANTVKQHLGAAMRKLGVHTRAALAHRVAARLPAAPDRPAESLAESPGAE